MSRFPDSQCTGHLTDPPSNIAKLPVLLEEQSATAEDRSRSDYADEQFQFHLADDSGTDTSNCESGSLI